MRMEAQLASAHGDVGKLWPLRRPSAPRQRARRARAARVGAVSAANATPVISSTQLAEGREVYAAVLHRRSGADRLIADSTVRLAGALLGVVMDVTDVSQTAATCEVVQKLFKRAQERATGDATLVPLACGSALLAQSELPAVQPFSWEGASLADAYCARDAAKQKEGAASTQASALAQTAAGVAAAGWAAVSAWTGWDTEAAKPPKDTPKAAAEDEKVAARLKWSQPDTAAQTFLSGVCGLEPPPSAGGTDAGPLFVAAASTPQQRKPRGFGGARASLPASKTAAAAPPLTEEWDGDVAAKQQWVEMCAVVQRALEHQSDILRIARQDASSVPVPPLHFVLPAALAPDADVFEALLRWGVYREAPSAGALALMSHTYNWVMPNVMVPTWMRDKPPVRGNAPPPELRLIELLRFDAFMKRLLARLLSSGCRGAAQRLARFLLEPPPRDLPFASVARSATPVGRWSSLRALQPVTRGEVLVFFLPLADSDAAWAASIDAVLSAAEQGSAGGVFVHCFGVATSSAAAAAEQRLEDAVTATAGKRAMASSAAMVVPFASVASPLADQPAAQEEPSGEGQPPCLTALLLLDAAAALQRGDADIASAQLMRDDALALMRPEDATSDAVAAALLRLDIALAHAATAETMRAAADEAAEPAMVLLAARLAALPRWEAALAAGGSATGAAFDALSLEVGRVREAAALSQLLAESCAALTSSNEDARPAALAAMDATLQAADAAPRAVTQALAVELAAAISSFKQGEALVKLSAAHASGNKALLADAMTAAFAARADPAEITRIALQPAAVPTPAQTPASPDAAIAAADVAAPAAVQALMQAEPGEWARAGDSRIWYNRSSVLGHGSRGTTVFSGMYLDERGRSVARAAVKRLCLGTGSQAADVLDLAKREVALLSALQHKQRIVSFHGYHADADWVYMSFERCERSLAQALDAAAPAGLLQPPAARLTLLAAIADALADVHDAGYAHNDLHAGNVLLSGDGAVVKITDMQLAVRAGDADQSRADRGFSMTTFRDKGVQLNLARRPPEVLAMAARSGVKLTPAVDIWALGLLAFQVLTGEGSPFAPRAPPPPQRRKQGGGAAVTRRTPSAPAPAFSEAAENLNIMAGRADLSALDAAGLSARAALEARHLLAACLAVTPRERPTIAALRAHPLFWDAPAAAAQLRALHERQPEERALRLQLEAAGMSEAYARLADWQAAAHGPLLESHAPRSRYGAGLAQLLRFARNAHEHPPPASAAGLLPRALPPSASLQARRDAVVEHLLECWPELALAAHVCLAKAGRS